MDSSSSSSTFYYLTLLMIDMHILMKNNSSYGIKDCIYIYFPAIRYQIPYVIISPWVTSEHHYNLFQLSLLLESFVIAFRLNAPFLIKCYYRQLSVFSITKNIILVEITFFFLMTMVSLLPCACYRARKFNVLPSYHFV